MYRLTCFGEVSVLSPDHRVIRLRSQKHLALLTYLAANRRRAHDRDTLASLFWNTPIERARHSLSQALYDIRKKLDSAVLRSTPSRVRFATNHLTYDGDVLEDAVRAERFAAAVDLYEGGFAPGLDAVATGDFERWVEEERRRLDELARIALHKQIDDCYSAGRWSEMYIAATKLVRLDPLEEPAHRAVIQALWLHGDQHGALRHYDRLVEMLKQELDAEPDEETTALVGRIRSSRPAAAPPVTAARAELPLVGRGDEFAVLQSAATALNTHEARLIYLDGEAGIGKTRLVREFARSMELAGLRVLTSRCYSAESDAAYLPILEGIRGVVAEVAGSEDREGGHYHQLGHLFPEYPALTAREIQSTKDPEVGRRRMYEEVADVVRRSFGPRTVWIIEDVHWIDASSASLLHYLLRRLRKHPLLLVMTARRHVELTEAARKLLDDARSNLRCDEIALAPLDSDDIEALVRLASADADQVIIAAVQRYSGGNPFYALEIARSLIEATDAEPAKDRPAPITPQLRDLLAHRVRGLDRGAARILESVAVLERHAAPTQVARMAGLSLDAAADAATPLYSRRLLVDSGDDLGFPHDIVREFVYDSLGSLKRTALHLRAGELLTEEASANPAIIARHFSMGGDKKRAHDFALRAAEESAARSAHEEAASMAELAATCALTDDGKAAALKLLARARFALGHFGETSEAIAEVLSLGSWLTPGEEAENRLLAARSAQITKPSRVPLLLSSAESAIESILHDEERVIAQLEVLHWRLRAAWEHYNTSEARSAVNQIHVVRKAVSGRAALSPEVEARALCSLAAYYTFFESSHKALRLIDEAMRLIDRLRPESRLRVLKMAGAINVRLGRPQEGARLTGQGLQIAKKLRDLSQITLFLNNIAAIHLDLGEFDAVSETANAVMDLEASLPDHYPTSSSWIRINLASAHFYSGNCPAAEETLRVATHLAAPRGARGQLAGLTALHGLIQMQGGNVEEGRAQWQRAAASESIRGEPNRYKVEWLRAMFSLANPAEAATRLRRCAEEEKSLEQANYLKLSWLSELISQPRIQMTAAARKHSPVAAELRSVGLGWFVVFSSKWMYRFSRI